MAFVRTAVRISERKVDVRTGGSEHSFVAGGALTAFAHTAAEIAAETICPRCITNVDKDDFATNLVCGRNRQILVQSPAVVNKGIDGPTETATERRMSHEVVARR